MECPYDIIDDHRCICGEGPLWDQQNKRLFWIDILKGQILCLPEQQGLQYFDVGQKIGAMALCSSGRIIAALKGGLYSVDYLNGKMDKILDPEPGKPDNRLNDGKTDPAGRFWIGSMSDKGETGKGSLYTLEKNGAFSRKLEGLSISNGLAWDADRNKFYHIDTPTRQVIAYDYCNDSDSISNARSVVKIEEAEGLPDGMTVDTEGMLWIAHWNGGRVSRWDPKKSKKIQELSLPVSKVTSCIFGGDKLDILYVTTASVGLSEQELIDQPLAGATFAFRDLGVQGVQGNNVDDSGFH